MSKTTIVSEGDTALCATPIPNTQTPPFEPTWEKFCAAMHDTTGRVVPNQSDPRWRSYFNIFAIGYIAGLRDVLNYPTPKK